MIVLCGSACGQAGSKVFGDLLVRPWLSEERFEDADLQLFCFGEFFDHCWGHW